jgi:hypothetical protein
MTKYQGFGFGYRWARIQNADPDPGGYIALEFMNFFLVCKNVLVDIFSREKKIFILTGPKNNRNKGKTKKKFP